VATDDELNPTTLPRFTRTTKPYAGAVLALVDMRGNVWKVWWDLGSKSWSTAPLKATYGMPAGKLAFFGEDAGWIIDAIEAKAEEFRIANKPPAKPVITSDPPQPSSDGSGLFLVLLFLALLSSKGRR